MSERPELPDDLFDLPIDGEAEEVDPGPADRAENAADEAEEGRRSGRRGRRASAVGSLPLFQEDAATEEAARPPRGESAAAPERVARRAAASSRPGGPPSGIFDQLSGPQPAAESEAPPEPGLPGSSMGDDEAVAAGVLARLQAGAADLLAHLAVLSAGFVAMRLLGLQPALDQWPGFASFLALFSFLYLAFPLAFWGHTPGMAWFGLLARDVGDRPLAFGQTGLRVVGTWLTAALLGVPVLLALSGRSLVDRISGSETWQIVDRGDS